MEQTTMDEILKFGEFSSLLNKSSYSISKNGGTIEYDHDSREDQVEDLRSFRRDSQGLRVDNGGNIE